MTKKNCVDQSFQNVMDIQWFGHQVAVCVNNWNKNVFLGVVNFKSSTLGCLLLKLLYY